MYIDSIPIRILNVFLLFLASSFRLTYSGQVVLWFGGCGGIVMVSCSCSSFGGDCRCYGVSYCCTGGADCCCGVSY